MCITSTMLVFHEYGRYYITLQVTNPPLPPPRAILFVRLRSYFNRSQLFFEFHIYFMKSKQFRWKMEKLYIHIGAEWTDCVERSNFITKWKKGLFLMFYYLDKSQTINFCTLGGNGVLKWLSLIAGLAKV